jgi:hypothetical protein
MSEYTLYMATALLVTMFVFTSNQVFSPAGADDIADHEPVQLSSIGLDKGNRWLRPLNK